MDILVQSRDFVFDLIYYLPMGLSSYILRVGFLLALSSTTLFAAWVYLPWRTVHSQVCIAVLSIAISLYVPVEEFRNIGKEFLTLNFLIALCCIIFLPSRLAFFITPRLGNQLRLKKIIIASIWIGLIVQIIASM